MAKITPYISTSKRKLLLNAFFKAQFSYCPLGWMCHSLSMNNKIHRLHERCLRIIYNDKMSSLADLLAKDGSVTTNTRNLVFAIKFLPLKYLRHIRTCRQNCRLSMSGGTFCVRQTHYKLRNPHHFAIPSINCVYHPSQHLAAQS